MNHHEANLRPMAETERLAARNRLDEYQNTVKCLRCRDTGRWGLMGDLVCDCKPLDGRTYSDDGLPCFHCGFTPCKCPQWKRDEVYGTKPSDHHGSLMNHLVIIAAGLLIAAGIVAFYLATNH